MPIDWARAVRLLKRVLVALAAFLFGLLVFLVVDLSRTVDALRSDDVRRSRVIDYLEDDAESDACRDELEDTFLATIGALVLSDERPPPDDLVEFARTATDRIARAEELCPAAEVPPSPDEDE